jgi:hypothetical protein
LLPDNTFAIHEPIETPRGYNVFWGLYILEYHFHNRGELSRLA